MDLGAVMDEVAARIDTIEGLRVFAYPPDNVAPPAAIVDYPDTYTYDDTFRRGMDRISLPVMVLVGKVSERASRDRISDWLSRSGARQYRIDKTSQLTKHTMTVDSPNVSQVEINDGNLEFTLSAGNDEHVSNLRDLYIREDIVGEDFHARATFDPPFYGDAGGGFNILPQHGIALRYQTDATKQRAVMVWQNIFGVNPVLLVGVWEANLNGTGFVNRQTSTGFPLPAGLTFPYTVECRLRGNIVTVRQWQVGDPVPEWTDGVLARTINLDTDAGDSVTIPTPDGEGTVGVAAAHLGTSTSPQSMVRYPLADMFFELDSVSLKHTLEADLASYTAFDSLRVQGIDFDYVRMAGVDYLAATLTLDIAGEGEA